MRRHPPQMLTMSEPLVMPAGKAFKCYKTPFRGRRPARKAAELARKSSGLDIVLYRCRHCGFYHLTRRTRPPARQETDPCAFPRS